MTWLQITPLFLSSNFSVLWTNQRHKQYLYDKLCAACIYFNFWLILSVSLSRSPVPSRLVHKRWMGLIQVACWHCCLWSRAIKLTRKLLITDCQRQPQWLPGTTIQAEASGAARITPAWNSVTHWGRNVWNFIKKTVGWAAWSYYHYFLQNSHNRLSWGQDMGVFC